jgi:hypothetical protein
MNTSTDAQISGTENEAEAVCEGFLAELAQLANGSLELGPIRQRAQAIETEHLALLGDEASRQNLHYATAVLAGYEALRPRHSHEQALELLKAAFVQSGTWVREKTRAWLDGSQDGFTELVNISKQREAHVFGDGFVFERERDDNEAYLLNVRRCFWHDFFTRVNIPDLTRVLCEFDRNWFEAIDPARHGFRFERATTLGYGGSHCPFNFVRVRSR